MGGHHAGQRHPPPPAGQDFRARLALVLGITVVVLVAQIIGTVWTGSLALLADTVHMAVDSSGLMIALLAAVLVRRPGSTGRTWGFRRVEVLAALVQALVLFSIGIYAAAEGISRLNDPSEVPGPELLAFGIIGLAANLAGLYLIAGHRGANLNMRAAFLEVLADAFGSVGVIVAAVVITTTGWYRADAIAGLFIAALIVPRAISLARDSARVLLEFTPQGLDLDAVRSHVLAIDHVREVHELHASTVGTGLPVLSAHVVVDDECFRDGHAPQILQRLQTCLAKDFDVAITHTTFQVETETVARGELSCAVAQR